MTERLTTSARSWAHVATLPDDVVVMAEWFPGEPAPSAVSHTEWLQCSRAKAEAAARSVGVSRPAGVITGGPDDAGVYRRCAFLSVDHPMLVSSSPCFDPMSE